MIAQDEEHGATMTRGEVGGKTENGLYFSEELLRANGLCYAWYIKTCEPPSITFVAKREFRIQQGRNKSVRILMESGVVEVT